MTQKEALDILKTGRNVFLTGAAGSGKTYVLREYISYLNDLGAEIGVTASTGIAATHMGGTTVHSWSGIGIRDYLTKNDILEIASKKHISKNIKNASVLIIDEISMLHHFRLDLIDKIIREIKNVESPFGGIQVVFCGDFFQLPPVRKSFEPQAFFAYHSQSWKDLNLKICYLSEQHRQNDTNYMNILNAIRENNVSEEMIDILKARFNTKSQVEPTKLYSHNKNVDEENELELSKLSGKTFEYQMEDRGRKSLVENLKKSCLAPETLRLKVGAKVMFVKNNFDEGYVNGTLGIVADLKFDSIKVRTVSGRLIEVEKASWVVEEDDKIKAEIKQYPLRLAWAITIHKSQGMSLDLAEIDLSRSFERGMGYVALSRVRSLDGLFLKGFNHLALKVDEEVLEFDKKFKELSKTNSFHISTMGEKKVFLMHDEFAEKIKDKKTKPKEKKVSVEEETRNLIDEGLSLKSIAKKRGVKIDTVLDTIEKIKEKDPKFNLYNLRNEISKNKFKEIYLAFRKIGISEGEKYKLAPVKEILGPKYSYTDLRLVRLFL